MLLAAVLWGTTGTAAAFAPATATPIAVGAARIVIGGLLLLLVALPGGAGGLRTLLATGARWPAGAGAASVACYQISFFSAVAATGVAVGTVVTIGSAPVFTGIVSRLAGGRALTRRWMLATAAAITGAAVLVGGGKASGVHLAGVGLGLLAGLFYAVYAVVAARLITGGMSERAVMGGLFGGGAVLLLPVLLAGPLGWLLTAPGAAVALHLGVVTTAVAYLLYARGLRTIPAPVAVTLGLAEPAVAALLAVVVLGERLTATAVTGIILIGLALAVLAVPGRGRPLSPAATGDRVPVTVAAMSLTGHDPTRSVAENYRAFSRLEARGRSRPYEILAAEVADDPSVLDFLASLPPAKRQPNLLFAAARYLLGRPAGIASLRALVADRGPELASVISARRTQTNEPARCASLLPALMLLRQPLALLEVGASAGLTLIPDRYSYDYAGHRITGTDPRAPVLRCEPSGPVPLPDRVPAVRWRAGLDLNPLDVTDDADMHWLGCLLWPGERGRGQRLAGAIAAARRDPPAMHRGDLLTDLPALARQAPPGATLVIYHSAVMGYLSVAERGRFAGIVGGLDAVWLSNEPAGLLEGAEPAAGDPAFQIARDGHAPLALTDPHGTWLRWLA